MKELLIGIGAVLFMLAMPWLFYVADVLTREPVYCEQVNGVVRCEMVP